MVYQDEFLKFSTSGVARLKIGLKSPNWMLQVGVRMGVLSVQSPNQGGTSSSPKNYAKNEFLGFTTPWSMIPTIPAQGEFIKDGRKLILKIAKDGDGVSTWLKLYTGFTVTVTIPHLGLAWSSTLSFRRSQRYLYVRVPANLRSYLLPFWQSNTPIPVVISMPPITLVRRVLEGMDHGQQ
jgi:hypothetical protein